MSDIDAATYILIGSGALTAYTGHSLWLAYSSLRWPKAIGHIVRANAEVGAILPSADDHGFHPGAAAWTATFVCHYNVRGTQWTGTRLRFTPFTFREARRAAEKYVPGHGVRVAVHPTQSELAVLEAGPTALGIAAFMASLALALVSAAWFIINI